MKNIMKKMLSEYLLFNINIIKLKIQNHTFNSIYYGSGLPWFPLLNPNPIYLIYFIYPIFVRFYQIIYAITTIQIIITTKTTTTETITGVELIHPFPIYPLLHF